MKYNGLRKIVQNILFETTYLYKSTEDHRAGQFASKEKNAEKEIPISPDDVSSVNSIVSRPPVEDDSYIPTTSSELSAAVKALSELMNTEEIAATYVEIRDVFKPGSVDESRIIESMYDDYDGLELPYDEDMPEEFRSGYSIEEEPEDNEEDKSFQASKSSGEASLQDLLDLQILPDDVKSISGAKSYEGKAKRNLAMRSVFGIAEVEKAQRYALDIWVGALKADNRITEKQAEGFLQNVRGSTDAPAFKAFFQLGFFGPAIKPMINARNKQVKKEIETLGTPKQLVNMLFSQTTGLSPVNGKKIRMKLNDIYKDASMTEVDEMVKKFAGYVKSNSIKFQKDYFNDFNLKDEVKKAWSKKSTDEKIDITYAAMDEVIDSEDKIKKSGL